MPSYAAVHILDVAYHADKGYVYSLSEKLRAESSVGTLLSVPFGKTNRRATGIITDFPDKCDYPAVKPAYAVISDGLTLSDEFVRLCLFMRSRCFCSFGAAVKAVLPPGYDPHASIYYSSAANRERVPEEQLEFLASHIKPNEKTYERDLVCMFGNECREALDALVERGFITRGSEGVKKLSEKNITVVRLNVEADEAQRLAEESSLTEKQSALVALLLAYPRITLAEIEEIGGLSSSVVNTLCKKGIVIKETERTERIPYADEKLPEPDTHQMNEEQQYAFDTLKALSESGEAKAALLLGVTGSGKTKVIAETVKAVLNQGKNAIIMLPEIGLTAVAMRSYKAIFGDDLVIIHSMLSAGERVDAYRAIREGRVRVVLGTRSAVFAPLKNIGVIVMDEEQEGTYKSELTPKYHARDIARFRAGYHKCLLLLASATPSMESYHKAISGVYTLLRLRNRICGQLLPEVVIEDIRADKTVIPDKLIGKRLTNEINERIAKGQQAILFANRRGFNSLVSCRACGTVMTCPNCSVALTYHAYMGESIRHRRLSCHYCGYSAPVPQVCPSCGGVHIGFFGFGTQKLQEELEDKFKDATSIRMDTDTTSARYSHDRMLERFREGEASILFGTQMVCKGLDFPNVSLAAVVSVDSLLYMNDFRASERTFSLLTQLIGRAGRAKGRGLAVLQTMNPDHEVLRLAATQDYEAFARGELAFRKSILFPPFCAMAVFSMSSESEDTLQYYAQKFPQELHAFTVDDEKAKIQIYGPYHDGIYKIGGRFRQRVIIKYSDNEEARKYLANVYRLASSRLPQNLRLDIDINPNVV